MSYRQRHSTEIAGKRERKSFQNPESESSKRSKEKQKRVRHIGHIHVHVRVNVHARRLVMRDAPKPPPVASRAYQTDCTIVGWRSPDSTIVARKLGDRRPCCFALASGLIAAMALAFG